MARAVDMMFISVQQILLHRVRTMGMNENIPTGYRNTYFYLLDATTVYKIAVDLYTLMMMYEVHNLYPAYSVNTYNSDGSAALQTGVERKRVMTGATTTMRGWQAIVGWSWAASGHASSNLSNAGYVSSVPKKVFSDRFILNLLFLKVSLF